MRLFTTLHLASTALAVPHLKRDSSALGFYVALQSTGIVEFSFDPTVANPNKSLSIVGYTTDAGYKPGWITAYQNKIYSISRTAYPDNSSESGGVFAFQRPGETTSATNLTLLDSQSSNAIGGVYVDVSPDGRTLSAADIDGSTVSVYPLAQDGTIGSPSYIFRYNLTTPGPGLNDSQEIANPHESTFDPSGQFMFVPDRGADRLYVYSVDGPYDVVEIHNITLPLGTGPRHITFQVYNTTRTYMYLVSELDNTVRVFTLDYPNSHSWSAWTASGQYSHASRNLTISLVQTISALNNTDIRTAPINENLVAEIAITNDNKFAYASIRNTQSLKSDTLSVYSIDSDPSNDEHRLTWLGSNATLGKTPRHFALSNDVNNTYVAVGNEVSQSIVVFERDVITGFMKKLVGSISLGALDLTQALGPVCILWK